MEDAPSIFNSVKVTCCRDGNTDALKNKPLISWEWDRDEKYASFWLIDVNQ